MGAVHRIRRLVPLGVIVALLAVGVSTASAVGPTVATTIVPTGRYEGTAVGTNGSAPIAVTVWLEDRPDGGFRMTFSTSQLPVPVSVSVEVAVATGGFDIPVAASWSFIRLSGEGTVRIRLVNGQWIMYGEGSGSFRGKEGGGYGSATLVTTEVSAAEQIMGAFEHFTAFGPPGEAEGTLAMPERYVEGTAAEPTGSETQPGTGPTPVPMPEAAFVDGLVLLLLILLIFL